MDFSGATILCLGDIMLDRFAYCAIERISPEAPVPVLLLQRTETMLGGAGNVARNIAALGGNAVLLGLLGVGAAGHEARAKLCGAARIADAHVASAARPTVCKTRYIAGHQQIMRVDEEQVRPLDRDNEARLIAALDQRLPQADAIVLSDYGKGVLSPAIRKQAIDAARRRRTPLFVDPKSADFRDYRGAACITPNQAELALAAKMATQTDDEVVTAAMRVMREAKADAILATRSDKGMVLVEASGAVHFEAAREQEVFDVSGAGDTVVAVLALAHACGEPLPGAMRLANIAAGIVVGKLGTAVVELDELMLALARERRAHDSKLHSAAEAQTLARQWQSRGLKVGFTNGCFDIVHPGHVAMLAAARRECDRLIVALNSDASTRRLKGPSRPVNALASRAAVIAGLASVDAVISFDADTPLDLICRLRPDVLMKGADYTVETTVGAAEVMSWGGRVALIELIEGHSTSAVIDRLQAAPAKATA
ncbi:MAG: D-glycero-beta-D-manno-heptose-7-phosphate kinase [Alphaproteobacteria bacterium]|nr:D-glycero-beta-D-manno-heptose-7-phosphate kinase [Alphaproteobacteria bacterium]